MLKGRDNPYFLFSRNNQFIKLKNDYIYELGDTVNFIIISDRRDLKDEQEPNIKKLR